MKLPSIMSCLVAAGIALVSSANATQLNQHAASFHAYIGTDQTLINHWLGGVSNTSPTLSKAVVGTPPRNPHSAGSQVVSITGYNSAAAVTTYCTVYSYNSLGTYVSSKGITATGVVGYWTRAVSFTTAQAPSTASYAVYCTLRPSGANRIHSTRVYP